MNEWNEENLNTIREHERPVSPVTTRETGLLFARLRKFSDSFSFSAKQGSYRSRLNFPAEPPVIHRSRLSR
ncbi:MAG TPA: hypothetical protein DEB39_12030 [Planctomycetaceae bacterium]|nr:hypothetical protein [Planctomycetaceae bacterium]